MNYGAMKKAELIALNKAQQATIHKLNDLLYKELKRVIERIDRLELRELQRVRGTK